MRRARVTYPGAFHHAMNRGYNGNPVFFEKIDKEIFLKLLNKTSSDLRIRILAYCLMDNHYHLVIQNSSGRMSDFFKQLDGQFGTIYRKNNGGRGYVFQDRYKSMLIQDDPYLLIAISYILKNPARAEIVKNPFGYKWSSINEYFKEPEFPLTDKTYVEELFETEDNFLHMIESMNLKKLPTIKTDVGTIIGGERFGVEAKKKFDRRKGNLSLENKRIDDKSFEPVEKVFWEFEKKHKIEVNDIKTHTFTGKKQRAEFLCNLKDLSGLKYREIIKFDIFSDLKMNSLPSIYKKFKE